MNNIKESQGQDFFDSAFNLYYERVVLYIYRYCKDWSVAENIAQDTYITFWENLSKVDECRIPLPYLLFVAKNKTINYLNREIVKTKHSTHLQKEEMLTASRALECSTMSTVHYREIEFLVRKSLTEMTPKTKEFFQMSRYGCKKNEEIAQIMGVSVKTVEYRIMSALRVLRKNLKDYFNGH
ncbi:MAG: sigma-70 family RNA polymerase sigma factor [Bacteroidales bacterium]|jgi:RNA polymerase sigma-70 factor (ECF subfamily)